MKGLDTVRLLEFHMDNMRDSFEQEIEELKKQYENRAMDSQENNDSQRATSRTNLGITTPSRIYDLSNRARQNILSESVKVDDL